MRALLLDFYGTVAHEDDELIALTCDQVARAAGVDAAQVTRRWRRAMREACANAQGDSFVPQRVIERDTLAGVAAELGTRVDVEALCGAIFAHWTRPPLYEDARALLESCPCPVYIVSNIDRADVEAALGWHGLRPAGVFTSEDARSYKPRPELFRLALESAGLTAAEVWHVGDSLSSDVEGARRLGIRALWLNRQGRPVPPGVEQVADLRVLLNMLTDNQN